LILLYLNYESVRDVFMNKECTSVMSRRRSWSALSEFPSIFRCFLGNPFSKNSLCDKRDTNTLISSRIPIHLIMCEFNWVWRMQ
jgi:hypothetical protein